MFFYFNIDLDVLLKSNLNIAKNWISKLLPSTKFKTPI